MQICNLPDDALRLVLQKAVVPQHHPAKKLRANLPLLSVCQKWRRFVFPLVYDKAHITCGTDPNNSAPNSDAEEDGADAGERAAGAEPTDARLASNLDIVVSAGCLHMVKVVEIRVFYQRNPLPGLKRAVQEMRSAAAEWKGARMLSIKLSPRVRPNAGGSVNVAEYAEEIRQTSSALTAVIPGIIQVSFYGANHNNIPSEFFGQLAEFYAGQLQKIYSGSTLAVSPGCSFKQLRSVAMNHQFKDGHRLPRIYTGSLERMDLVNWSTGCSWAPFSTDGNPSEIEFPCLKKLYIAYVHDDTANGGPWKLHFPALRCLHLRCLSAIYPPLKSMVLPPRMKSIVINVSATALQHVLEIVPLAAEHFSLNIGLMPGGNIGTLVVANRILASVHGTKTLDLVVGSNSVPVLPELIMCTSLTYLVVRAPTSLDTMLGLIHRLPRLTSLGLWKLTLDEIQADISVPAPGEGCVVEPFDTQLKFVSINVDQNQPSWEMVVPVTKYLLLRIPTLARLNADHAPEKPIMDFVQQYSEWYPHLTHINFSLNDSDDPFKNRGSGTVAGPWRGPTH